MSKGTVFIGGTFGNEGSQGGQGGGTNNYPDLNNKPKINDVTLEGNKTLEQLGIVIPKRIKDDPTGEGVIEGNLQRNKASGLYSRAEGSRTIASGEASHAEGDNTDAISYASHAEGVGTTASGPSSHAEGWFTTASGKNSHAEGSETTASGKDSHAEGFRATASSFYSHAEGVTTTASGEASHAEGGGTTASGRDSHAEGIGTEASGVASHAEGWNTKANRANQHVFGMFNIVEQGDSGSVGNYAEIVGNGTGSNRRSNARTLSWDGKEWLADTLEVSREPETENEVATKGYVDGKTMKRVVVDEEKLIGEWVEGGVTYDLYEKTVYFGELTNAEQKQVIHGVTNYVRFVGIRGMAISSNNNLPLPFAAVDSTKNIYLAVGSSKITITPGSDRTGHNAWITLEYIKNKEVE